MNKFTLQSPVFSGRPNTRGSWHELERAFVHPQEDKDPLELVVTAKACQHQDVYTILPTTDVADLLRDFGVRHRIQTARKGHCEDCRWEKGGSLGVNEPQRCRAESVPAYLLNIMYTVERRPALGPVEKFLNAVLNELTAHWWAPSGMQKCQHKIGEWCCGHETWYLAWTHWAALCVDTMLDSDLVTLHNDTLMTRWARGSLGIEDPDFLPASEARVVAEKLEAAYRKKYPSKRVPWLI